MIFIEIGRVFLELWEGKETPNLVLQYPTEILVTQSVWPGHRVVIQRDNVRNHLTSLCNVREVSENLTGLNHS